MNDGDQAGSEVQSGQPQPGLKFLETAVYIMGGLLVAMLLVLLGGVAWKVMHKTPPEISIPQIVDVAMPEGGSVTGVTMDGDRMAVHVVAGVVDQIIVIDTRKGVVISRIKLRPTAE